MVRALVEDVKEEVLERMPEWFKILREAYARDLRRKH